MNKIQCKKCLQLKTSDYFLFKDSITNLQPLWAVENLTKGSKYGK